MIRFREISKKEKILYFLCSSSNWKESSGSKEQEYKDTQAAIMLFFYVIMFFWGVRAKTQTKDISLNTESVEVYVGEFQVSCRG